MRGLIVKDMLIMRKNLRTYAVFMGFYLIMSALDLFPISFTTAIIQIIVMMLPMGASPMTRWPSGTGMPCLSPQAGGPWWEVGTALP